MKKLKILYTIPNFKTAGSQYVVLSLIQKLDVDRYDVFIAVENHLELVPNIIPVSNKFIYNLTGQKWKDAFGFRRLLKKHKIDLVHSWDYKSLDVEVLGSRLAGVKYLFTKKNAAWSKRWFLKSLLASHIAYDNPFMKKNFFSHKLLKNKITFIPHGVNTKVFFPMELAKEESSNFNICCIGNINNNKNQGFIVDALKDLPVKIHLNLYGKVDPSYMEKLDIKITNSGLKDRVHFKGFVENINLPKVLNEHDIFILASVREGLPVSILEALACGLPVLSSDSGGGARYIFKENLTDSVFELSNPKNFKALVLKLYNNKDYYTLKSRESLSIVRERFQLEREVEQYEKLYLWMV